MRLLKAAMATEVDMVNKAMANNKAMETETNPRVAMVVATGSTATSNRETNRKAPHSLVGVQAMTTELSLSATSGSILRRKTLARYSPRRD